MMANSLDLDPEYGAIDLLEEVEATFGIEISDGEAECCCTVGDLYEVLEEHLPDWDQQNGNCGSSMVFYRVRRALTSVNNDPIAPSTPLSASGLTPSRLFNMLGAETELRLPLFPFTTVGKIGAVLFMAGLVFAIVALFNAHWIVGGVLALLSLMGFSMMWLDEGRYPSGVVTVGDLVQRTVPLNSSIVKDAGGRPADRWSVLTALASEYGVLAPQEISPDTFLHRKSMEQAKAG